MLMICPGPSVEPADVHHVQYRGELAESLGGPRASHSQRHRELELERARVCMPAPRQLKLRPRSRNKKRGRKKVPVRA